jgi:hypothetical protein
MLAPALTAHTAGEFATLDLRQLIGRDLRVLPWRCSNEDRPTGGSCST